MVVQFIDLAAQQARIREQIYARIARVLSHGEYIMGPEVSELEASLSAFCGARHCLSCANGTDALLLALLALGVGEGDAVLVPSFTFAATAEVVPFTGATPVFVDVDLESYAMDPQSLKRSMSHARRQGLRPAVVVPVDLFGLPADYDTIADVAWNDGAKIVGDSAQAYGAVYKGRMTGTLADITTTSFFPAKPLGCYGDGGAVFTEDDYLAAAIDSYRIHGKGREKYDNARLGMNSRLDTIQAAILLEKLLIYGDEIHKRQEVAARYTASLASHFQTPVVPKGCRSVWAQYTVRAEDAEARDAARTRLSEVRVPSAIYYPLPLHRQKAYRGFPADPQGLPNSERAAQTVFSLPMHPYLDARTQERIVAALT